MIIIINYHSVSDKEYDYAVTPTVFRAQLKYAKSRFRVISLTELEQILFSGHLPAENLLAITFDDGFRDNYLEAWPILRELSLPATIFVPTKFVGQTVTTPAGLRFSYLDWPEMQEMRDSGLISFQSHTHSHPILTSLTAEGALRDEFSMSQNLLQTELVQPVSQLAYPKGRSDALSRRVAADYFHLAFGGNGVIQTLDNLDRFNLPRVTIRRGDNWWKFIILLSSLYWKIKHV